MSGGYWGMEGRLGLRTAGYRDWHQFYQYPRYGIGFQWGDQTRSRPDTSLSNPVSLFFFYEGTFYRKGVFSLNTGTSVGLSYMSLVFDAEQNPYNDVVASHVNLHFNFSVNMNIELGEHWDLTAGYGVTHYSNGKIHEPQKGLNNWGWKAGASYLFGGKGQSFQRPEYVKKEVPDFVPFEDLQFMLAVGVTDWHPGHIEVGQHYFTASFTTDYAFHWSRKSAFTIGLNALYDGSLERAIKGIEPEEVKTIQKIYLGGHIGYQHTIDRVTLMFNLGTYFYQHSKDRGFAFARAGGRILLVDNLALHICIKTKQGVRSDWIEWGLAYSLKTR
jgi:hypothetical protein